jgi:hypothetical protein
MNPFIVGMILYAEINMMGSVEQQLFKFDHPTRQPMYRPSASQQTTWKDASRLFRTGRSLA